MFAGIAKAIFGSSNDRYVKSMQPLIARIAAHEPALQAKCTFIYFATNAVAPSHARSKTARIVRAKIEDAQAEQLIRRDY